MGTMCIRWGCTEGKVAPLSIGLGRYQGRRGPEANSNCLTSNSTNKDVSEMEIGRTHSVFLPEKNNYLWAGFFLNDIR